MENDFILGIFIGVFVGFILCCSVLAIQELYTITISKETAKEICVNFTNNTEVTVDYVNYKLICVLPDENIYKNIIIKNEKEVNAK